MKHPIFLFAFAALLFLSACKKNKTNKTQEEEEPAPVTPAAYPDYSMLKTGNYWVYEVVLVKGSAEPEYDKHDSCYIAGDTMIRGSRFFKHISTNPITGANLSCLRDSLHYLINSQGEILFSSEDYKNILETGYVIDQQNTIPDTVFKTELQMVEKDSEFKVAAGSFVISNARKKYSYYGKHANNQEPAYVYNRYAKNVGLICQSYPFASYKDFRLEKRLLKYRVN